MTLPDTKEIIQDGNLAFALQDTDDVFAVIGASSGGVAGVVYQLSNPNDVTSTIGYGDAPEAIATELEASGGIILFSKPVTTPESAPTITQPAGTPPVVGATGSAYGRYDIIVKITKAGILGTSTFQVSKDGGDTYSPDIATAATYLIPNTNVTLTFAAGTYVLADQYTTSTKGPLYSVGQFNTAYDVLVAGTTEFSVLQAVGVPDGASDTLKSTAAATMAANLQSKMDSSFNDHNFYRAIMDGPDIANDATGDGLLSTALASTAAPRVVLVADFGEVRSPIDGGIYRRPAAWALAARVKAASISEDAGYVLGEKAPGKLMSSLISIRRDEAKRQGLNDARIATLRTHKRKAGFYVTKAKTLAVAGSDYALLQHGRIIDKACRTVREGLLPRLNGKVQCNKDGTIFDLDAKAIEADVLKLLKRDLLSAGHAVSATVKIDRLYNVLSNKKLRIAVSILPYAYPEIIETTLGFAALLATAA